MKWQVMVRDDSAMRAAHEYVVTADLLTHRLSAFSSVPLSLYISTLVAQQMASSYRKPTPSTKLNGGHLQDPLRTDYQCKKCYHNSMR